MSKRHRFVINSFLICDNQTGYILDTGVSNDNIRKSELGFSGSVMVQHVELYLGIRHIFYTDNWYSSPGIAVELSDPTVMKCPSFRSLQGETVILKIQTHCWLEVCDRREVYIPSSVFS